MAIIIKNWHKFQHFKDRRPPWIKLYRDILDDPQWWALPAESARVLVAFWLIASEDPEKNGTLPDERTLLFRLRPMTGKQLREHVTALSHWLIQDDITMISPRYQDDTPETETETETETNTPLTPLAGGNELFAAQEPQAETPKAKRERKRKRKQQAIAETPGFTRFWEAWPKGGRKAGREQCMAKWAARNLEQEADKIVNGVEAAKKHRDWTKQDGDFIPAPIVWLNEKRWEAFADLPKPVVYQPKTYKAPWAEDQVVAKVMALPADTRATLRQQVLDQVPDHDGPTKRFLASRPPEHPELCRRIVALLENAQAYDPTIPTAQQEGSAKALQAAG
jgi:hypothetical protein